MSNITGLGLGRVVIYVSSTGDLAAIVSKVCDAESGLIRLHILDECGVRVEDDVLMDVSTAPQPNTWHWPPRL